VSGSVIKIDVKDSSGKKSGSRELSAEQFSTVVKTGLLHQLVRWQRSKRRAGTHAVKTRATVSGGGIKPWRQKGTGRARAGSIRSPLWVKGGIAHGPKPRSYEFDLNKKQRKKALSGALSTRLEEGRLLIVKDFSLEQIKTKQAVQVLENIGVAKGKKALVVVTADDDFSYKSLRNISGVKVIRVNGLNVYDVVNSEYVVLTEPALDVLEANSKE
jgi:large subunit ribosomal protein L4